MSKGCCDWLKRKCEQLMQKFKKESPKQDNQKDLILNDKQLNNFNIVKAKYTLKENLSDKQNLEIDPNDLRGWDNKNQSNDKKDQNYQVQEELLEMRNILIVGQIGVGKRKFFKSISGLGEDAQTKFPCYIFQIGKFQISLINSPNFQMNQSISQRDETIKYFREYFDTNKEIDIFLILVNFERTDMMHEKIQNVYRYIKKFKEKICIGITQFQLSEDKITDQEHLMNKFERFVQYRRERFLFFEQGVENKQLQEQIFKLIDENAQRTKIDLKDTFFEDEDVNEQQKLLEALQNNLNQNMNQQIQIRIQN